MTPPLVQDVTVTSVPPEPHGVTEEYEYEEERGVTYAVAALAGFDLSHKFTGKYWVVVDAPSGIFGQGESPLDALKDFLTAASEHLDVLQRQDALSDDLAWQLDYLKARLPS